MKHIVTLLLATATIDLIVFGGSSFSQKPVSSKVDSSAILADPKFQKFIADTTALSKKFEQKVDCVRAEYSITKQRIEGDKKLIKTHKTNFEGLYEIQILLNRGRRAMSQNTMDMPHVTYARPEQPKPLPVRIDTTPPDSLAIPKSKRSFFEKIFKFLF